VNFDINFLNLNKSINANFKNEDDLTATINQLSLINWKYVQHLQGGNVMH